MVWSTYVAVCALVRGGNPVGKSSNDQSQKKGIHLNTVEFFYIYKEASVNSHPNDEHTIPSSKIFETILKYFQR